MAIKKIALKKIYRPLPTKIVHLQMAGELYRKLGQYRALYKQVYGDDISVKEVMLTGLEEFFDRDVAFQEALKAGNLEPVVDDEEEGPVVVNGHDKKAMSRGREEEVGNRSEVQNG